MAKFCSNCGKEVDEKAVVCVKCGVALVPDYNLVKENKPKKGKGIASMILGIVAIIYTFSAFSALSLDITELLSEFDEVYNSAFNFGYAIGLVIIQLSCAITGICLACSERSKTKNGFNTAGFWLSLISIILCAILFALVLVR